jgi:HD-GYP domain-containing protein (c-di-GMP phosphodiesterase class II)
VDWHVNDYYSNEAFFSFIVLDFEIRDKKQYVINTESVVKFVATAINTTITRHVDSYTIENNKFVILLVDKSADFAKIILNKIITFINQKYSGDLIITAGVAECPDEAVTHKDLYRIALNKTSIIDLHATKYEEQTDYVNLLNKSLSDIQSNIQTTLFNELSLLIKIIHQYDPYLGEHSALVTKGCILLGKEIGLPWQKIEQLAVAALLHDIGYTAIPKEIYNKNSKLTAEEWKIIRLHPTIACEHILKPISLFDDYIPLIQNHHECLDGSGYPFGKKGDQVPLGAQIISIVDTYHAMKTDRPHRQAMPFEDIIDYYIKNAGIKWNEELVTMFAAILADNEITENLDKNEEFNISLLMNS